MGSVAGTGAAAEAFLVAVQALGAQALFCFALAGFAGAVAGLRADASAVFRLGLMFGFESPAEFGAGEVAVPDAGSRFLAFDFDAGRKVLQVDAGSGFVD